MADDQYVSLTYPVSRHVLLHTPDDELTCSSSECRGGCWYAQSISYPLIISQEDRVWKQSLEAQDEDWRNGFPWTDMRG